MTTRSTWMLATWMRAARTALLVPLLVAATGGIALGAGGKRAGVPKFDGAQEVVVRKQVMKALKAHGYALAKSREMDLGLANTGALLESDDGFAKVAKELALSVIVTGEIGRKRAKITVHDGSDGSLLGQAAFPGANPRKMAAEVARTFWSKLGGEVERGRVPSGAKKAQKVVAEAPDDDESAPDADDAAEPKAKLAERGGASEGKGSADSADDSGSRRDKDSEADDNVVREEASAALAARLRAADVRRVHRAHRHQPRPRLPSGRQPDGHAPLLAAARRRDGLARRLVPDQRPVQRPDTTPRRRGCHRAGIRPAIRGGHRRQRARGQDLRQLGPRLRGRAALPDSVRRWEPGLDVGHRRRARLRVHEPERLQRLPGDAPHPRHRLPLRPPRDRAATGAARRFLPHARRRVSLHLQRGRNAPR